MAISLACGSAFRALPAAPVPRPPQPINPTLSTSLPAAWALRLRLKPLAGTPAVIAVDVLKKSRREDLVMIWFLKLRTADNGAAGKRARILYII